MIDAQILRRNIEKFRKMLDEETNNSNRRTIESIIREFEGMLSLSTPGKRSLDTNQRSSDSTDKNS